jgi:Fur family transcriptional regulator, ferric uptake regulator
VETRADSENPYGVARLTPRRRLIAETARAIRAAFTVDDLAESVRNEQPDTGLATVYRAVAALEASGWLERVGDRDGSTLYAHCPRAASGEHHHHVVCDVCGRTAPTACPLPLASQAPEGFVVTRHEVTLYGLCADCASADAGARS